MRATQSPEITGAGKPTILVRNRMIQVAAPGRLSADRGSAGLVPGNDEVAESARRTVGGARLQVGASICWLPAGGFRCGVTGSLPGADENLAEGTHGMQVGKSPWGGARPDPGRD